MENSFDLIKQLLLRTTKEARELKKQIRRIDRELAKNGYNCMRVQI